MSTKRSLIYKRLHEVPERSIRSNCGTPTEKISELLDRQLKPIMQKSWSYIKDSGDFIRKNKNLTNISEGPTLVTANVVGLYPRVPYQTTLEALKEALRERE